MADLCSILSYHGPSLNSGAVICIVGYRETDMWVSKTRRKQ